MSHSWYCGAVLPGPEWESRPVPVEETDFHGLLAGLRCTDAPTGQTSIIMACLAMYCRMQRVVEIGVYKGGTAVLLAHALRQTGGSYVGVDISECWEARDRLIKHGLTAWFIATMDSKAYAKSGYDEKPIDLLFIDGDHTMEGCLNDWLLWTPFVRPGGYVFIDNSLSELGVRQALEIILSTTQVRVEWSHILIQQSFGTAMFKRRFPDEMERLKKGEWDK
jgi:predicted O-methyltransferase YrrM